MSIATDYYVTNIRYGEDGASSPSWTVACDTSRTGQSKSNLVVIATFLGTDSHTGATEQFLLRWRNHTDNPTGNFVNVATGQEIQPGDSAGALVNGTTVTNTAGCQATISGNEEVENESPLQTGDLAGTKFDWLEIQWCIDLSSAGDGDEYEFEVYSSTGAASCGIFTYTLTIEAAPQSDKDDQDAQIVVYLTDKDDQEAQIEVYEVEASDQDCQIDVWSTDKDDQDAEINVFTTDKSDQECEINITAGDKNDQECQIEVWSSDKDDQDAQIDVYDSDKADQPAQIDIYDSDKVDQDAEIEIWDEGKSDQDSEIDVWDTDKDDQECQIYIYTGDKSNQPAQIDVWDEGKSDQDCQIEVYNTDKDDQECQIEITEPTYQYARPDGDVNSTWSTTGSNRWDEINDVTPSDSDYIYTSVMSTAQTCTLSDVSDPEMSSGHKIVVRAKCSGASSAYVEVKLTEGAHTIATFSPEIDESWNTYEYDLTGDEADDIDDYSVIRFDFTAYGSGVTVYVSQAYLQVPGEGLETGTSDQPCQIDVYDADKDDQPCQIDVYEVQQDKDDQEAQIEVWDADKDDQECQIDIYEEGEGLSNQPCQIDVSDFDKSDQPAQIDVWDEGTGDQPCEIEIWSSDKNDQECQIDIYEEGAGVSDQSCEIDVWDAGKDNQPCQIDVYEEQEGFDDQEAQIDVYLSDKADQESQVLVYDWWKTDQPCQIDVTAVEDLSNQEAQILIYGSDATDQPCQIQVVAIEDLSDQICEIFVYGSSFDEQEAQIYVWGASFSDQLCWIEIAGPITLKGYVHDAFSVPLKDVHVRLFDDGYTRLDDTFTDAQGYFELEPPEKGIYILNVYRAGRERAAYRVNVDEFGAMWFEEKIVEATTPGEGAGDLVYTEIVSDDEGAPVSRVRVRVYEVVEGAKDTLVADDRTEDNGSYTVYLEADTLYRFTFMKPRYKFKAVQRKINRSSQLCQMEVVA